MVIPSPGPLSRDAELSPRIGAIVVGVSAGAINALSVLLPALPRELAVAVIVVVHVSAGRRSLLCDLFRARCAMRVREPVDKEPVGAGTIWFAPPDYHLLVERERTFALSLEAPVHFSRPSIDVLFESAADAYGSELLAIVLTSASCDGSAGALSVRSHGGTVVVQEPDTADAPLLPRLVIAQGSPHKVGTLLEICDFVRATVEGGAP
jgi:two-component system chemotaxis response regulator CheB